MHLAKATLKYFEAYVGSDQWSYGSQKTELIKYSDLKACKDQVVFVTNVPLQICSRDLEAIFSSYG